ncbi:MAG: ATP-binding protein [Candidatus Micrarchaeota archaeon]|nr:ATP-binding protein [Candidatus Micrarchaeota archaeon]
MSYDIPDEIKYREKIVFGLDLKQLCYLCLFGLLAFLSLSIPIKGQAVLILPSFFSILGVGFIFLNLEERVLDAWHYYGEVRKAPSSDKKAQRLMGIHAIENNQMILVDGSLRAVLQVEPINFSLLDEGQKTAFVSNYREFLNHLTDSVQILVRTEKSDAEDLFAEAQSNLEGAETEIASFFRDFFTFEREFMEANNVKSRRYYLVVAQQKRVALGKGNAEEERKQLDQKAQIIQEKLSACGLRSERLSSARLTRLFTSYSVAENEEQEKEAETKKGNPHINSLIWLIIKTKIDIAAFFAPVSANHAKKEKQVKEPESERASSLIEEITPDFDISISHAGVNGIRHRIIKAVGYPRNVEDGWLEQFMATSEPYDVSIHIHPASISRTLVNIHNQIIRQTSDLLSGNAEHTPNPALEIKRKDTLKVYGLLYKGKEKMFDVSLYVDNQARDLEELALMEERCKANMNAMLIVPKRTDFRMADGIKSMLPVAVDALEARREFLTSSLCATFPFLYPVDSRGKGTFFAHERRTLNPLFIDFDAMSNKHFFVLGISGSGKSYAAKFLLMQHILSREAKIYVLDPNAEYSGLVERLGGTEIDLSKDSDKIINLFDLAGEDFGSKMLTLISVFDIITGGLSESQKGVLNEALVRVYRKKGIDAANPGSWERKAPTFSDLKGILEDMKRRVKRRTQSPEEKSVEVLLNRVRMYSRGGFFGFLDRGTKVDLNSGVLSFNLSSLPPQVKQLVMFSVLELVSREMRKDKKPKVVLIDEGWSLLRSKEAEDYILEFIKTSRKFNASIGFITQEIEDLMRSEGGRSILNTTSTKILMRQNSSNLDLISKTLALNDRERDYLLRAEKGQGLMINEQGRYEFIVKAPPMINALITTDPNEKRPEGMPVMEKKKEKKDAGEMDCACGFYLESELSDAQKDFLATEGFVYHRSHLFDAKGSHRFVVRRQPQESPEHSLLCWGIAEEIRKHGGRPEVLATVGADVSVKVGKRRICFEVETGSNLDSYDEEHVKAKFEEIRKEYDMLIVVVTDRKQRGKYEKIARAKAITRTEVPEAVARLFR